MKCPDCHIPLQVAKFKDISIHECLKCQGKWFERDELIAAKNKADEGLRWLNFDPFGQDAQKLSIVSVGKQCPQCSNEMQSLLFLQSKVIIEKCQSCQGVWLNSRAFENIIFYLEKVISSKSEKELSKETFNEFIRIFTGHEGIVTEVKDFLAVLNILETRIAVEHPHLTQTWKNIESVSPFK